MKDILAVITTFNPDIELLERNLKSVIPQVGKVLVFDNNSNNRDSVIELCNSYGVELKLNTENQGVAGPLHDGVLYALNNGFQYILTLDQDSVLSPNAVSILYGTINSFDRVAMAGCNTYSDQSKTDRKFGEENGKVVFEDVLITSGTLAKVKTLYEEGNYNKCLFIDHVDHEICYRLASKGYRFLVCVDALMEHHFGEKTERKFLFKKIALIEYSSNRLYYFFRNSYYLGKIYPEVEIFKYHSKLKTAIKKILIVLFLENNKIAKIKAVFRGRKDGEKMYKEYLGIKV